MNNEHIIDKEKLMNDIFAGSGAIAGAESIMNISARDLVDFHTGEEGHVFAVEYDDDMKELESKIEAAGKILEPLIVRPDNVSYGKYEIISGHRRRFIGLKKGYAEFKCIVLNINDEDAIKLMIATNLDKRKKIRPSNLARAYKAYMEANKRQAGRPKNNSSQVGTNFRADEKAAEKFNASRMTIQRTIRLCYLIPELADMVDGGKLKQGIAVELSYLDETAQTDIYVMIKTQKQKITLKQAELLHRLSMPDGRVGSEAILDVLNAQEEKKVKVNEKTINKILPKDLRRCSPEDKIEYIKRAIKAYEGKINENSS